MSSTDESSETALVAYTKFAGDMARAVQETISLREIRPENRVVVDGGMYIASATNLVLEPSGFLGFLFLAFYREMPEDSEDKINVTPPPMLFNAGPE